MPASSVSSQRRTGFGTPPSSPKTLARPYYKPHRPVIAKVRQLCYARNGVSIRSIYGRLRAGQLFNGMRCCIDHSQASLRRPKFPLFLGTVKPPWECAFCPESQPHHVVNVTPCGKKNAPCGNTILANCGIKPFCITAPCGFHCTVGHSPHRGALAYSMQHGRMWV